MTDDKRRKLDDAISELDLRLDGLLGKLGASLGEMVERLEHGEDGEIRRSHEIRTPKGPLRAETGIRVRVGGTTFGGAETGRRPVRPVPPGDLRPERASPGSGTAEASDEPAQGAAAEAAHASGRAPGGTGPMEGGDAPVRTPHLEAYATEGRWHLCADLPGVTLTDVDIGIEPAGDPASGATLTLTTRGARRYAACHPLPVDVDPDDMSLVLRNGVLEIGFGTVTGQ